MTSNNDLRQQLLQAVTTVKLLRQNIPTIITHKPSPNIPQDVLDTRLDTPLAAVADIAKLTKAHTTKTAIAFKPPLAAAVASRCVADGAALMLPMLGALVAVARADGVAALVVAEVGRRVGEYFQANETFFEELAGLAREETGRGDGLRLVNAGKVWQACDALVAVPTAALSAAKLLASKVVIYGDVIKDAAEEVGEDEEEEEDDGDEKEEEEEEKEKLSEEVLSQYKSTISKIPVYFETVLMVTLRQVHKTEMNGEKLHSGTSYDRMYALLKSLSAQVDDLIVAAIYDHDKELAAEAARQIQADLEELDACRAKLAASYGCTEPEPDSNLTQIIHAFTSLSL